jgi:adenine-specific DNA methylase
VLRSRKKLGIFGALPPYLGGKRRLCPLIFREIDRVIPRSRWRGLTFLDAFLGGGSVSLYAKAQGFQVIATDIAERSMVIGRGLIENSRVRLTHEDILRVLASRMEVPGRIESSMSPSVFTRTQARFIDSALRVAVETPDPAKANLIRLLALRFALLCHAYAQVRKGTIHRVTTGEFESITESAVYHYVDALRLHTPVKLWELAQQINAGVFEGRATVMKRSILEALPEIQVDVAYFDPPYPGVMSYEREYKVIDEILEGQSRRTSPFTAKDGANMIDGLFERATHIPIWILSLGNAVVGVEELEAKMAKHGRRVKSIALRYQHLPAVATEEKKRENKEFVVVGVDGAAPLLRAAELSRVGAEVLACGIVEQDANSGCSQGSAAGALAGDSLRQGQAALSDQATQVGTARKVTVQGHTGLDDPDAGLVEGSLDLDGELW